MAKLAFDTGGTFTDFALLDDDGELHLHKVLSTPKNPAEAVVQGAQAQGVVDGVGSLDGPPAQMGCVKHDRFTAEPAVVATHCAPILLGDEDCASKRRVTAPPERGGGLARLELLPETQ